MMKTLKSHVGRRDTHSDVIIAELMTIVSTLQEDVSALKQRISQLEYNTGEESDRVAALAYEAQRERDERGWKEKGARYQGKHPYTCACDRCLRIGK